MRMKLALCAARYRQAFPLRGLGGDFAFFLCNGKCLGLSSYAQAQAKAAGVMWVACSRWIACGARGD